MTGSLFAPLSIPSPPVSAISFTIPIGEWLHWIGIPQSYALSIPAYAVAIVVGIIVAGIWTSVRLTKRGAEPGIVLDLALPIVILGFIGSRLDYVLRHFSQYFGDGKNPANIFGIADGGFAPLGVLIGGALGIYIGSRFTGMRFWSIADALAPGLLVALAFGALGTWFNHSGFGVPTDLPWGLSIEKSNADWPIGLPAGTLVHPIFLYSIVWYLFGAVVLLLLEREYRYRWGKMMALTLVWYGLGNIWFESIRIDPTPPFLGVPFTVWTSIAIVILGFVILAVQSRRHLGLEPSVYQPGRGWVPKASEVDSDETYSDTDDSGNDAVGSTETPATSGAGTTS